MLHSVNQQGCVPLQQGVVPLEIKQEMIDSHNTEQSDDPNGDPNGDPSRRYI